MQEQKLKKQACSKYDYLLIMYSVDCTDQSYSVGIKTTNKHFIKTESGFAITRGIDLTQWITRTRPTFESKTIEEEDILAIKHLGYDHVRISIDEQELWNEDGLIIGKPFLYLKKCIDWCMKHSLRVIVALKSLRSFSNQFAEGDTAIIWHDALVRDTFFKIWKNLSDFLCHYPKSKVAYQLLSMPNAPGNDNWNSFVAETLAWIRHKEQQRVIIIGANKNSFNDDLRQLQLPTNDENIIVSFQYYTKDSTENKDNLLPNHPQLSWEEISIEEMIKKIRPIALYANQANWKLYCFGITAPAEVPNDVKDQFSTDLFSVLSQNSIAHSASSPALHSQANDRSKL